MTSPLWAFFLSPLPWPLNFSHWWPVACLQTPPPLAFPPFCSASWFWQLSWRLSSTLLFYFYFLWSSLLLAVALRTLRVQPSRRVIFPSARPLWAWRAPWLARAGPGSGSCRDALTRSDPPTLRFFLGPGCTPVSPQGAPNVLKSPLRALLFLLSRARCSFSHIVGLLLSQVQLQGAFTDSPFEWPPRALPPCSLFFFFK